MLDRQQKEKLKEQIEKMDENEQTQLFHIIRRYTDHFTKTENGVFVSSDELPTECFNDIEKYILFCSQQKKRIDEQLKLRKQYEKLVKS